MNMDRFMLIGVEIEDESKVFKYLRHSFFINDSAAKIKNKNESSKKNAQKLFFQKDLITSLFLLKHLCRKVIRRVRC